MGIHQIRQVDTMMKKTRFVAEISSLVRFRKPCLILARKSSSSSPNKYVPAEPWVQEPLKPSSIKKAEDHYDDFYSSVFGRKWPSIRLGLLTEAKYIGIPNAFLADVNSVHTNMEKLGAFDMKILWDGGLTKMKAERKDFDNKRNLERMKDLDRKLESIAHTRVAEEMETLYQNAPDKKRPVNPMNAVQDDSDQRRILSDVREANQEYVSASKLKGLEEFNLESEYFTSHASAGKQMEVKDFNYTDINNYTRIDFPPYIRPWVFEAGSPSSFPSSGKEPGSDLRCYLCINGASLAPVIAMDLKPEVKVLDLCAAPGTKSLLALMTMCPESITCNDLEGSRIDRMHRFFKEFTGNSNPDNIIFTKFSATNYPSTTKYDRILADVPCLMDRISLTVADNSIFKSTRIKERLGLVKAQTHILLSAFKCLAPEIGSSCVYSTCTLSPIENDGVVGAALRETEIPNLCVDLKGIWEALLPFRFAGIYNMSRTKFGVLIHPNLVSNVGPMYVSRIVVQR